MSRTNRKKRKMWIVTNKSYMSIVQDNVDPSLLLVRARIRGDIETFLDNDPRYVVIEMDNSDYRFRAWVDREVVKEKMLKEINNINYDNFKNSVKEKERKAWYTRIWSVMFQVQESLYGVQEWWKSYPTWETRKAVNEKPETIYKRKRKKL